MKNLNLKSMSLLGLLTILGLNSAYATDCTKSYSYILAEYAQYGIHKVESSNSPIKRVGSYEFTRNDSLNRVYEVEIANIAPIPTSASKFKTVQEAEKIKLSGIDIENEIEVVIMPDDSLQVVKGFTTAHALRDMGESTLPAIVVRWDNLNKDEQRELITNYKAVSRDLFSQRFEDGVSDVVYKIHNTTDEVSVSDFQIYQSFHRQWEKYQKLIEILEKKYRQMPSPQQFQNSQNTPGKLDSDSKAAFMKYREEYFKNEQEKILQKQQDELAQEQRKMRIAHLDDDENLIMIFDRIDSSDHKVGFNDLFDYSENKILQSAVNKWVGKVSKTNHPEEESLLSELIIMMKMSLIREIPERTKEIDSLTAQKFNDYLVEITRL